MVLRLLLQIALIRLLDGPSSYGRFIGVFAVAGLVAPFLLGGANSAMLSTELSGAGHRKIVLYTAVGSFIAFGMGLTISTYHWPLGTGIAVGAALANALMMRDALRASAMWKLGSALYGIAVPLAGIFAVLALGALGDMSPKHALLAIAAATYVTALPGLYFVPSGDFTRPLAAYFKVGVRLAGAGLLASAVAHLDLALAPVVLSDESVGFFAVATKAAKLVALPGAAVALWFVPRWGSSPETRQQTFSSAQYASTAMAIALAVMIIALWPRIPALLGPEYRVPIVAVVVLVVASLIAVATGPVGLAFIYGGRATEAILSFLAGGLVLLVGGLIGSFVEMNLMDWVAISLLATAIPNLALYALRSRLGLVPSYRMEGK